MPALRRTEIAGELAALNGTLVDLLLTNVPMAELMAVQDQVRMLLDQLEEASEPPASRVTPASVHTLALRNASTVRFRRSIGCWCPMSTSSSCLHDRLNGS